MLLILLFLMLLMLLMLLSTDANDASDSTVSDATNSTVLVLLVLLFLMQLIPLYHHKRIYHSIHINLLDDPLMFASSDFAQMSSKITKLELTDCSILGPCIDGLITVGAWQG